MARLDPGVMTTLSGVNLVSSDECSSAMRWRSLREPSNDPYVSFRSGSKTSSSGFVESFRRSFTDTADACEPCRESVIIRSPVGKFQADVIYHAVHIDFLAGVETVSFLFEAGGRVTNAIGPNYNVAIKC